MGAVAQYVSAVKAAPKSVLGLFKGPNKIKNIAFATGGAVGTYFAGGIVTTKILTPALNMVGAGAMLNTPMAKRLIGGMVPFTCGFIASKFIKGDIGKALMVGGAVASIVEIAMPGKIAELIAKTPITAKAVTLPVAAVAGPAAAAGPVSGMSGLGAYVDAPAYQGVGAYVDAPAYQGVGGYVDAPAYQGVGDLADADYEMAGLADADYEMAGVDGFIDDSKANYQTFLA